MGSRIQKLESSISSLETDLEKIQKRKSELKELTETATNEINNWKKKMGGILILFLHKSDCLFSSVLFYFFQSSVPLRVVNLMIPFIADINMIQ